MSRKHFSWLFFGTFIIAGLVLLMPGKTGKESSFEKTRLLPGLESRVNHLDWLRVTSAGGMTVVTLRQTDNAWVVEEAAGYRADWVKLKKLLVDLSRAEIIEAKTANPDYYDRLGVQDVSSQGASGLMIEFAQDSGLPSLIVGKAAQGRTGQYVRLKESAASALIDRQLDIPEEQSSWLDEAIIDINDAEVVEVTIGHPDGETVKISKVSADDENFELQDIPEGRKIKSDWTVNAPANALAALTLEAVAPQQELDWSAPLRFSVMTADGLLVETEVAADPGDGESAEAGGQYWIRLKAGLYTTAVGHGEETGAGAPETVSRAESINAKVAGWAYRIPKYKFDSMSKRMADLLLAPDS